jgi:hypothetical protein
MGNILTPETPSVTTKIKTVLKKLDHHSAHISRRLNIIARETATIENRLKKNLQSRKSLGAGARRGYLAHEMSTQVRAHQPHTAAHVLCGSDKRVRARRSHCNSFKNARSLRR